VRFLAIASRIAAVSSVVASPLTPAVFTFTQVSAGGSGGRSETGSGGSAESGAVSTVVFTTGVAPISAMCTPRANTLTL